MSETVRTVCPRCHTPLGNAAHAASCPACGLPLMPPEPKKAPVGTPPPASAPPAEISPPRITEKTGTESGKTAGPGSASAAPAAPSKGAAKLTEFQWDSGEPELRWGPSIEFKPKPKPKSTTENGTELKPEPKPEPALEARSGAESPLNPDGPPKPADAIPTPAPEKPAPASASVGVAVPTTIEASSSKPGTRAVPALENSRTKPEKAAGGEKRSGFRKTAVVLILLAGGAAAAAAFHFGLIPFPFLSAEGGGGSRPSTAESKASIPNDSSSTTAQEGAGKSPGPGVPAGAPSVGRSVATASQGAAVHSGPAPAANVSGVPKALEVPSTKLGQARQVLEGFLAAKNWQQRLLYSLNIKGLKESMAAHFRDHPDGPVPVEGISLLDSGTIPGTKRAYFGFRVRVQGYPADIPTAVEEGADGSFRVDWAPFLETYEQRLRKFFENPGQPPGQFRVVLRRRHYFGPAVPGQGTARQPFTVESPMRDESWFVWADLNNPNFTNKIAARGGAGWDVESFVVLSLEWSGDEKTGRWVTLKDLVADNWQMR